MAMGEAPFVFSRRTSASLIWGTVAALLPALAWGIFRFGSGAALAVASSIAGALAGEAIVGGLKRRFTLWDGSAFLTGLLVGMAMPPGISPFIPATASLFATAVVKGAFGGLGSNWMNPALAGIAFSLIDWPEQMRAWIAPAGVSAISGATPLGFARNHAASAAAGSGIMDILASGGFKPSGLDSSITEALNRSLFSRIGADLPGGYVDLLIGNKAGAIGELSALLILAASVFLISRRMIRWEIPASIVGSFALLTWVFGGLPLGNGLFSGDALFALLSGSFLLVAFFMAPDPVTSPSFRAGMLIYGVGIGAACFLMRAFGSSAEGSAFAVILMNCAVPAIAKLDTGGFRRRASKAAEAKAGGERRGPR
jgi:Na+-translocating ferredoxin:NAD+ oxidoreductase subunit D